MGEAHRTGTDSAIFKLIGGVVPLAAGKESKNRVRYRVLHNSLPFSFSKIIVWSCLLWRNVTLSLLVVQ